MAETDVVEERGLKRSNEAVTDEDDTVVDPSDDKIGPLPPDTHHTKRQKVLHLEQTYLDNLPSSDWYERSYMHRDTVTHVNVAKTNFIITASCDGHVKFWKKQEEGIEFVKHFRAHLGGIVTAAVSTAGDLFCSIADDKSVKIFDVVNFDLMNMFRLTFDCGVSEWIHNAGDAISTIALSDKSSGSIYIYDGKGTGEPLRIIDKLHLAPVCVMKFNSPYDVVISADNSGMIEYWSSYKNDFKFPKIVQFEYKTDTNLYEFAKNKTVPTTIAVSPNGKTFVTFAKDRQVRVFKFLSGKLSRVFDESLKSLSEEQQSKQLINEMEFGRRLAMDRDMEKNNQLNSINIVFDETGHFILYSTLVGIKVINLYTNRCVRVIGQPETTRFMQVGLFQGKVDNQKAALTIEMRASDNPNIGATQPDPSLFCTAYKRNRFYIFTRRSPDDAKRIDTERDVFNEKPSKDEQIAATQSAISRIAESAVLHTSLGDIHIKLFHDECPKTVENFSVHSRNGFYNGHIFHRVIKSFMLQTGDPTGTGTGGESIWGGEFEDEFVSSLRHDRPYTVSMANAGQNTNGSQFFITVVPAPWLDNKHTVFGRVTKGMEVAQKISESKTHPKTDKPYEDISIINITVK